LREIVDADVSEEFARIEAPILYVGGKQDRLVRSGVIAQMRALRPRMELCLLDAPHFVLQRRPAEAAETISRFLLDKARSASSSS
jgi:pimeloyl-ACP methyl ester carboxylesterase